MSDVEAEQQVAAPTNDANEEDTVARLQQECSAMVKLLKNFSNEEQDLQCQLEILAREALLCGFDPTVVEPPAPKRRRTNTTAKATKKEELTKKETVGSDP